MAIVDKMRVEYENRKRKVSTKASLHVLQLAHVNSWLFGLFSSARFCRLVLEEAGEYNVVVDLWYDRVETVVLSQEGDQLLARSVDGKISRVHSLSPDHCLEEHLATAGPLPPLGDVEVQDTERTQLVW